MEGIVYIYIYKRWRVRLSLIRCRFLTVNINASARCTINEVFRDRTVWATIVLRDEVWILGDATDAIRRMRSSLNFRFEILRKRRVCCCWIFYSKLLGYILELFEIFLTIRNVRNVLNVNFLGEFGFLDIIIFKIYYNFEILNISAKL